MLPKFYFVCSSTNIFGSSTPLLQIACFESHFYITSNEQEVFFVVNNNGLWGIQNIYVNVTLDIKSEQKTVVVGPKADR